MITRWRRGGARTAAAVRTFGAMAQRYTEMVGSGKLRSDAGQATTVEVLDRVGGLVSKYDTAMQVYMEAVAADIGSRSGEQGKQQEACPSTQSPSAAEGARPPAPAAPLADGGPSQATSTPKPGTNGHGRAAAAATTEADQGRSPTQQLPPVPRVPRGVYLHGGVGTGKSMLMDLFFTSLPEVSSKRRVHFHEFMLEVHDRIRAYKQGLLEKHGRDVHYNVTPERDAIAQVAQQIAAESRVLCFDELQVTDIADAMILHKLFRTMFEQGIVLVATSNRAPDELYLNGLNRSYFTPCIRLIQSRCRVHQMGAQTDYRLLRGRSSEQCYFHPSDSAGARQQFQSALHRRTRGSAPTTAVVPVMMGREIAVPRAYPGVRACHFDFAELCDRPVGAADFKAICEHYEIVVLSDVPALTTRMHNQSRRFITLIDVLYEQRVRLLCLAALPPEELFTATVVSTDMSTVTTAYEASDPAAEVGVSEGELASVQELDFAFKRATSRLIEMQSAAWPDGVPTAGNT